MHKFEIFMKKINLSMLCLLLFFNNINSQNEYWNDNTNKSWYSIMCKSVFGPTLEDRIPELIQGRDCTIATSIAPVRGNNPHISLCGTRYSVEKISCKIESGPTHELFQHMLNTQQLFSKYPIQLRRSMCDMITGPLATSSCIILSDMYYQNSDALKLFILYHELQHHIYNDMGNNHLEKIINLNTANVELQEKLEKNKKSLKSHIDRYVEYRSDTKAMQLIECPYCLQEIALAHDKIQRKRAPGTYHSHGYLLSWQFEPSINELLAQKKCCQHHIDTGKQINISIVDESTLLNRLIITQE